MAFGQVLVAGSHAGRFGMMLEQSINALALDAIEAALADAGIGRSLLNAAYVGNAFGGLIQGQETILGQIVLGGAGIHSLPIHNLKNACSSGADAVHMGWSAIAYGQYDCVLVLGVEKMTHSDRTRTMGALASATDRVATDPGRSVFMDVNVERAERYMQEFGATQRHFALCAAKNRAHAMLNENAAVRKAMSVDEILADRVVLGPLTRSMCGGIADGAAAAILVSPAFARKHGLSGPCIRASGVVSGDPEGKTAGKPGASATARAARAAFGQCSIAPSDVSLAEVHDPTSPQELFDLEDMGLVARGGAIRLVEEGATSLGGRLPVNVSGGLTSRGHPVGATGVAQVAEITQQLRGRAGAAQVANARVGLAQMAGGLLGQDSAVSVVHILSN